MRRWSPGDPVVLRYVWRGRLFAVRPLVVVEDAHDQQMFCVFAGTRWKAPARPNGSLLRIPEEAWRLVDRLWAGSTILSFAWPDEPYAILLSWEQATDAFEGFYVNLQAPLHRTGVGFDTMDHLLDALIEPDRSSWRWKDEDELAEAVGRGAFTAEEARGFYEAGGRGVRRVLDGLPPFDRDWSGWEPDPSWRLPDFPSGWDDLND